MKSIKILFVILVGIMLLPYSVFAEENNKTENKVTTSENEEISKEVKVYFFRGEGCPHCAHAMEFFKSIEKDYGHLFDLIDFETYVNFDNQQLLQNIGDIRNEDVSGVPYIIIGSKSWSGYTSDYNEAILDTIKSEYEKDVKDRYDIMKLIKNPEKKNYKNDVLISIILVIVIAGIFYGLKIARKNVN